MGKRLHGAIKLVWTGSKWFSLGWTDAENQVSGSSLFVSVLLLWCCFVLQFLEGHAVCAIPGSHSTHSCSREATATIPILLKILASRRGPQKANWQLCFMSMPIEEWDSNHSFLLFLLAWSKYSWVWFTIKPFYCNQKHIYMAFCEEFSLYRCVGAASSVFQFKIFIFYLDLLSTWSCFK